MRRRATRLHRVAMRRNAAVIRTLLDAGADAAARDDDGITPWYYAQDNKALKGSDVRWRLNEGRFEWGHGPDLGKQRFPR
ncbi:MAG: hypothetical protein OXC09_03510 [Truepera sp.]|nr:hypothetical protein [Truepera sp.]